MAAMVEGQGALLARLVERDLSPIGKAMSARIRETLRTGPISDVEVRAIIMEEVTKAFPAEEIETAVAHSVIVMHKQHFDKDQFLTMDWTDDAKIAAGLCRRIMVGRNDGSTFRCTIENNESFADFVARQPVVIYIADAGTGEVLWTPTDGKRPVESR